MGWMSDAWEEEAHEWTEVAVWLALNHDHPHYPELNENGKWQYPYLVNNDGGSGGGVGTKTFDTLREAVQSAMKEPHK